MKIGAYYMYHNHHREYVPVDGKRAMDFLKDEFPADLMGFILDTHWIKHGSEDPFVNLKKSYDYLKSMGLN